MFKIESYITPIILNYLAKYVKNIRPQDFQVCLWEGEVTFQNLDLRLDVLEQELNLPFEFLSGHIHELVIQIPWTKITSEPIKVLINTIEFVLKGKSCKSSASNSPQHAPLADTGKTSRKDDETSSMGSSGLAMKIVNNINVQCQNIILKYVEEDIVVSMNVQYLSYCPANEVWQPAMVDINPHKVLMRKLINISDLTICLDKRNSAGQIDVCQEPVLYRCTLEIRFLRKYNSNTMVNSSITRIGIFTQALDLNLSSLQIPMVMRLIKFLTSLSPDNDDEDMHGGHRERNMDNTANTVGSSYLSWAWNLLPSFTFDEPDEVDGNSDDTLGHTKDVGIYVEVLNFTLKNSEFINDAMMGGIKRIRYTPIVRFTFGGLYFERVVVKEIDWSSTKAGLSSIYVEPLGQYRPEDTQESLALIETAAYTNMRSFIDKSLFDEQCMIAERGWGVTNYDDYITRITDDYLMYRSPILAFDIITYRSSSNENQDAGITTMNLANTTCASGKDVHKQIRLLSAGVTFRLNETFMQVKDIIKNFIDLYDSLAYSSNVEKIEIHDGSTAVIKQKSLVYPQEHIVNTNEVGHKQTSLDSAGSGVGRNSTTTTLEGSPKLHPPLVEDYDALMQGIPLCAYKIDLKHIRMEVYAKTEPPHMSGRLHKRIPISIKTSMPFLLLHFEHLEGFLATPINPDKLVHTTCQLPDKPQELLNACYDNYTLNVKEFSCGLVSPSMDSFIRLATIPKLHISYGTLLQPHHWKTDEVPIKKLDLQCDHIKMEFSKRELWVFLYLYEALWSYQPQALIKVAGILNHPFEMADSIALNCLFSKWHVKRRYYHTFDVWNSHMAALNAELLLDRKSVQFQRCNVLNTMAKMHNNQNKWLEIQIQFPCNAQEPLANIQKSSKREKREEPCNIALGIWMEKFNVTGARNLLDFLTFTCKDSRFAREYSVESDLQNQVVQNPPPVTTSHHTSSAPSTTAYQNNPAMPQIFGRKSSRTSNSQRKISHPEETIHYSSEKDERIEYTTTDPLITDDPLVTSVENKTKDEDLIKMYFRQFNTIIIYMEIAQSQLDVSLQHKQVGKNDAVKYTRFSLPRILLKSTFAEYITRSSLRLKVNPPLTTKTTFNWTIQFIDLAIETIREDGLSMTVLQPWQTTVTVAMNKRKQNVSMHSEISQINSASLRNQTTTPKVVKQKLKHSLPEHSHKSQENSSVSSGSLKDIFSGSEHYKDSSSGAPSSPKTSTKPKSCAGEQQSASIDKTQELVCLNLHLDSSTIYVYGDNIKTLQEHFQHLMKLIELASSVIASKSDIKSSRDIPAIKILTLSEDHQHIKEFMDLDSNSDISATKTGNENKTLLSKISLFCQWTIAKVIAEIGNPLEQTHRAKIIVELEDFLCTVDQGHDFTKYTSKIGNFNINHYCQKTPNSDEWLAQEYLRIRMLAETSDLPFLNVVITKVSLRDFYKRIGVKRKGDVDRQISEILVVMQAMEIIMDFDQIQEFVEPLCALMQGTYDGDQHLNKGESLVIASELPLMHFESKGITCYFPLTQAKVQECSVLICKIDGINVTPNLQNPLQRKPLRPDVYGKAASMGILTIPGSMVEDRQYELTVRKISAASSNWNEILAHMRNKDHNFHTNPAVEWNNPERKQSLRLIEIFKNFTLISIYAPNIVYQNILICGEAFEFNCSSDFVANINTDQLQMIGCHLRTLKKITKTMQKVSHRKCRTKSPTENSSFISTTDSPYVLNGRGTKSHSNMWNGKKSQPLDTRRFSRLGSTSQFESIDEDAEPQTKTDSGVQSMRSKPSMVNTAIARETINSLNSSSIFLEKIAHSQPSSIMPASGVTRNLPKSISLLAGVFVFNIFDSPGKSEMSSEEEDGNALISCTISQPSFMITQNIYDSIVNFSIFNLSLCLPSIGINRLHIQETPTNIFSEPIIDTLPGERNSTGIPPAFLTYKAHQTKMKMLEIDVDLSKPLVVTLSLAYVEKFSKNLMIIYNAIRTTTTLEGKTTVLETPLCRKSKVMLMKEKTLNADRLNVKCHNIALKLTNHHNYECNLVSNDLNFNVKYLTRPEKCSIKYSLAAIYLRTNSNIVVHPIAFRGSLDFVSEPWNRLPLMHVICKFNVLQIDVATCILKHLELAKNDLDAIATYAQEQWQHFQVLNLHDDNGCYLNRQTLRRMKCPSVTNFVHNNKSLKREEFYQDDLRAGAFQFVELMSDAVLPMPYQIQIIKKDYGIICWRYPQPRKMCKIHIYPVPMAISNPIHIKCRMEYFSEVHEQFLHYCDFWLSETISKEIKLPERDICATIWRVVILQSLVSVDGECFDTSEEDEELQSIMNIDEVLGKGRKDSDFMLHPRVLVACMKVDTTFQSKCVPKAQVLLSCNSIYLKLLNQSEESEELPPLLRNFHLAKTTKIPHVFLIVTIQNAKLHATCYSWLNYNLNLSLTAHVKYLDYGFLNMLPLLEETTLQTYYAMDQKKNAVNINVVCDRLRFNLGPSVLHTLLMSKQHWEECLKSDEQQHDRYALIPKCIIVNRTMTTMDFGQTGTHEHIPLNPKECYLYSFRSDSHKQELTLYISDEETNTVYTSTSIPIYFKFETESMVQDLCIGSKCISVKLEKLSCSQIYVFIQGQIELVSMVPHNLHLEFRQEGKVYEESNKPLEYFIERYGRNSFFYSVERNTNLSMRLMLADKKIRARTGDIPLRMNKKLPWLVKVPISGSEFISFWVRILREDLPGLSNESFYPQKILITIWPIFEITSMLNCSIQAKEENTLEEFILHGQGGRYILDAPATHLTEHPIRFKYNIPLGASSQDNYTLRLRSFDWQKFFWYDEQTWTIDNALDLLSHTKGKHWPMEDDEEEMKIKRISEGSGEADIIFNTKASRDFSCTLNLEVSPWGMFINGTGIEIRICELPMGGESTTQQFRPKEVVVAANGLEMLFNLSQGFSIAIRNGSSWLQSLPIFFENTSYGKHKRYHILTEIDVTDIVILRANEVFKFLLKLRNENGRKILKLYPKFGVVNYTKSQLSLLPFAMDHKENVTRPNILDLDRNTTKTPLAPAAGLENSIGISMTTFYDINFENTQRSVDSAAFVYFVVIKLNENTEVSMPISLALPFHRKSLSIQNGRESIALMVSLIEHEYVYYLTISEDVSPAVLINNQTDCGFIVAQTNAAENAKVSTTTPEYDGKHLEWYHMIPAQSKCYYTPPEWYIRFPEVESTLCNITLALYDAMSTKKTIKWSKPIRLDKTWKKFLHIPGHGDVKVIICDKHRVIRINIYYISQQMEFSVKDLRLRLSTTEPKLPVINTESNDNKTSPTTVTNLYTETPQFFKPDVCHHFRNECESRPNKKIRLFIKEIVLSLHNDSPQQQCMKREVVSLFTDDFLMAFDDSEDERILNVAIPNLQIDNQLFSTGKYDFPVILCAEELYEKTDFLPEPYYLGGYYKYLMDKSPMISLKLKLYEDEFKIRSLNCHFNPVRAYIEDAYITDFLDARVDCEPSNCTYRPKMDCDRIVLVDNQMRIPSDVESTVLYTAEPLHLRTFRIEPMSVLLSVHTSVRLYIALDHSPLSFSAYERSHLVTMPLKFGQSLGMHYLSGAIFGAGWVVGSLEILGSPSGLARSVTTGLKDFVSMPVRGLFRGPWGFIVGVTQGSASLLRNVTAGTVNSVTKLAASVARNLDRLTLDEEHIERTEALRRSRPQGFTEGLSQGMTGLGISMLGAVGGLAHHTLEARSTVEVFTGLSKGLVGAFTKPISGAAELLALAGKGMLQTVGFNAMPKQRAPTDSRNLSLEPSCYRTWKLLPIEMGADQILFYNEITLLMEEQPKRGYVFLTSTVFAIIEAEGDKLQCALPLPKVEMTVDASDKTRYYVRVTKERRDIEEEAKYTNERIINFLHTSSIKIASDSLYDLLQPHNDTSVDDVSTNNVWNQRHSQTLDWTFYINEHLGEYIMRYLKILNSKYQNL
ncbi:vacuolar protein sorting 13B isoform X1 [Haematobia irritans]|uniref:vacuolar protein sorting 13B isoform X1 n=1 Tax=Haematobia irritans TaxID=7368 RepID=UPI003F4F6406